MPCYYLKSGEPASIWNFIILLQMHRSIIFLAVSITYSYLFYQFFLIQHQKKSDLILNRNIDGVKDATSGTSFKVIKSREVPQFSHILKNMLSKIIPGVLRKSGRSLLQSIIQQKQYSNWPQAKTFALLLMEIKSRQLTLR